MLKHRTATLFILIISTVINAMADGDRGQRWEYSFVIDYEPEKRLDFSNGKAIDLDSKIGWGLGFGYHINNYISADFLFDYSKNSYTVLSDGKRIDSPTDMLTTHTMLGMTYNIINAPFTPFVSVKAGMAYVNSGISDGGDTQCDQTVLYPSCYESTYTTTKFSYGGAIGLRYDFESQVFVKGGVGVHIDDFNSVNTPYFTVYQLTLGMRY